MSPHFLATQAAIVTLSRGGTAVDAAIAINAVQGVVAPETCGIGGDLFALVFGPGLERPAALNSSGWAGTGAEASSLRQAGLTEIPQDHPAAVTIPGCVDGWMALHGRWGALDLGTVLEPAIRLAADGFPASTELASAFAYRADELLSTATDMYPGGRPPLVGDMIRRPDLARTLTTIAESGRDAFYAGRVADAISAAVDGMITPDDMAAYGPDWVEPLVVDVFGHQAWTVPPNSQGYVSLAALGVIERLGWDDPSDPAGWHLAIEAYRAAAASRNEVLADPTAMSVPSADLVSPDHLDELAAMIDAGATQIWPRPDQAAGGTAYMCVVDRQGLGVSLIQSNFYGIGSGRVVAGAGFLLHDRGRGFNLRPDHPNELTAGRRPLHTLSPTIWTKNGSLAAVIGTRGGHNQPQLVTQLSALLVGGSLDPATAMVSPRWATGVPAGTRDPVQVEPGTPAAVISDLESKGHIVEPVETPQPGWGPMSAIVLNGRGLATGAADPRVDTAAAAAL